jgi:hypothetical protein
VGGFDFIYTFLLSLPSDQLEQAHLFHKGAEPYANPHHASMKERKISQGNVTQRRKERKEKPENQ